MERSDRLKLFFKKYGHALLIPLYGIFYMICFTLLERSVISNYHVIHSSLDDAIPFCEYFVVPYLLWFAYIVLTVLYFALFNNSRQEYYRLAANLAIGMTLFLIISYIYPNGLNLRPEALADTNIFTHLVNYVYSHDTPTNVFPSIHVFNSIACCCAITNCPGLKKKPFVRYGSVILTISIILSTMFLKQHSVYDVFWGIMLSLATYAVIYRPIPIRQHAHSPKYHRI